MNLDDDFFISEVDFVDVGDGTVESKHPSLRARSWLMPSFKGIVAGAAFLVLGQASATDARVTPLESAALELEHQCDVARIVAQDFKGLVRDGQALVAALREGKQIGSDDLRTEARRLVAIADSPLDADARRETGTIAFIIGTK